jgi:hypothetical protein
MFVCVSSLGPLEYLLAIPGVWFGVPITSMGWMPLLLAYIYDPSISVPWVRSLTFFLSGKKHDHKFSFVLKSFSPFLPFFLPFFHPLVCHLGGAILAGELSAVFVPAVRVPSDVRVLCELVFWPRLCREPPPVLHRQAAATGMLRCHL